MMSVPCLSFPREYKLLPRYFNGWSFLWIKSCASWRERHWCPVSVKACVCWKYAAPLDVLQLNLNVWVRLVFPFVLFPSELWSVSGEWEMTFFCLCVSELSCVVDNFDFYCILLHLWVRLFYDLVKHQYLKVWNCWIFGLRLCVDVCGQWKCFWSCTRFLPSVLGFFSCHRCILLTFQIVFLTDCFIHSCILYYVWILIIITMTIIIFIAVISPSISKFWLRVQPAYVEVCSSNTVFSFCLSSYIYLNMMSMCFCFDSLFLCCSQYAWSE